MEKDNYRMAFAEAAAAAFRELYPEAFARVGDAEVFSTETVYSSLEKPKDPRMGRFALPVFRFVRLLEEKPPVIAARLADKAGEVLRAGNRSDIAEVTGTGGFVNVRINAGSLARQTITTILEQGHAYGSSEVGHDKTVLVEYSSPNIAKPFGVGHLRTTVIGNSLRRIFKKLGYTSIGINYPGDWGTQFGKMIVACKRWGSEETFRGDAISNLLDLYVRFHKEVETAPELDDEAREAFRRLEDGEPEATALWQRLKDISLAEFDRIYSLMGVTFDSVYGESFLNDKMEAVIDRLEAAGLTRVSEGALVVDLKDKNLPPALLRKADGATLYITRDLAGAFYRWEKYRFHESVYVVGSAQSDHFKQMLLVLHMLEETEKVPQEDRMADKIKHIDFGWVRFGQKTMSTRRGNIIYLEDVINKAVSLIKEIILEKNPDLGNIDRVAHQVGVGAVLFSQMSVRRQKDVQFVWDEVLNFEGETGPYLQYTHARLCSLGRKYGKDVVPGIDFELLNGDEERRIIEYLADFPSTIVDAARNYEPNIIVQYLASLAASFNSFYQRRDKNGRIEKILADDESLAAARMALVTAVRSVISEGLLLLGMEAPEEM
ncbi:MAG: arginine--tRNA ligase [Candidatus Zixiibacteriota bacterium]|nr:MAG: arginine--tRNA ligase [candidate division Zixibacteria bacterium]